MGAQAAASSAAASNSKAPASAAEEEKGPTGQEDTDAAKLRRKAKNGLFLTAEILALPGIKRTVMAILQAILPLTAEHKEAATEVRSAAAAKAYHRQAVQQSWLCVLCNMSLTTRGQEALGKAGISTSLDDMPLNALAGAVPPVCKEGAAGPSSGHWRQPTLRRRSCSTTLDPTIGPGSITTPTTHNHHHTHPDTLPALPLQDTRASGTPPGCLQWQQLRTFACSPRGPSRT